MTATPAPPAEGKMTPEQRWLTYRKVDQPFFYSGRQRDAFLAAVRSAEAQGFERGLREGAEREREALVALKAALSGLELRNYKLDDNSWFSCGRCLRDAEVEWEIEHAPDCPILLVRDAISRARATPSQRESAGDECTEPGCPKCAENAQSAPAPVPAEPQAVSEAVREVLVCPKCEVVFEHLTDFVEHLYGKHIVDVEADLAALRREVAGLRERVERAEKESRNEWEMQRTVVEAFVTRVKALEKPPSPSPVEPAPSVLVPKDAIDQWLAAPHSDTAASNAFADVLVAACRALSPEAPHA